jgi:hypothetical protein
LKDWIVSGSLQIDQKGREENLSNAFAGVVKETNLPFIR